MWNGALTFFFLVELFPEKRVIQGVIVKDDRVIVKTIMVTVKDDRVIVKDNHGDR